MNVLRYMLKKDMRLWLIITAAILALSGIIQILKYKEAYSDEPYYSQTFEKLSENKDFSEFYQTVNEKYGEVTQQSEDTYSQILDMMYGVDYDPTKPPVVIPSELVEKLFIPDKSKGEFSPTADEDKTMLAKMCGEISSQSTYRSKIDEQLENYDRNARRGVKDQYILTLADKLSADYNKVLDNKLEKPVDTRGANMLSSYLSKDIMCYIGVFILLFHIFSSEIQSGRYAQFAISKYGAAKFSASKIAGGYIKTTLFYLCYCAEAFVIMFAFSKDKAVLSAPVQVLSDYSLSTENFTVLGYFISVMALRFLYCLALATAVMFISYICRKVTLSAIIGICVTAVPVIMPNTYQYYNCEINNCKLKIILSCDVYNMLHGINYVNFFDSPVKLYTIYIFMLTVFIIFLTLALNLICGERGAVNA